MSFGFQNEYTFKTTPGYWFYLFSSLLANSSWRHWRPLAAWADKKNSDERISPLKDKAVGFIFGGDLLDLYYPLILFDMSMQRDCDVGLCSIWYHASKRRLVCSSKMQTGWWFFFNQSRVKNLFWRKPGMLSKIWIAPNVIKPLLTWHSLPVKENRKYLNVIYL